MSKAERTRQFIVEKTSPIFNTKGYAGTSIADMTDATGLTKGSIYGNFASKDEVALAAFDYNLRQVNAIIDAEMEQQVSARDKLLVYVRVYDNFLKYPFPVGGCPILNTSTEADDTHHLLRNKAAEAIAAWKRRLTELITVGIQQKEFRSEVNPEQVALTMMATIEGALMITKLTGKTNFLRTIMQSVKNMIEGLS